MQNALVSAKRQVIIVNALEGNLDLTIHCKSADDDLGIHLLHYNDSFSWRFNNNFFNTTLFYCSFKWNNEIHYFDIYKFKRDHDVCQACLWYINKSGPCRDGDCFPWNNN
jgi:hypothetical protein